MEAYQIRLHHHGAFKPEAIDSNLHLGKQPIPTPAQGQVLVRVKAVSLNHRDLLVLTNDPIYKSETQEGLVPGAEGVGVVEQSTVSKWKQGDCVLLITNTSWRAGKTVADFDFSKALGAGSYDGTLRQYMAVDADDLVRAPEHLSLEEAAALSAAYGTAWNALFGGLRKVQKGEWVLTEGTGGVSMAALHIAKAAGANVFAISSAADKLQLLKDEGATAAISYNDVPEWSKKALEATGGKGVDHVVDVAGSSTIVQALRSTRPDGLVSVLGFLSASQPHDLIPELVWGAKMVRGIMFTSMPMIEEMVQFVEENKIRPVVGKAFPWREADGAYRMLAAQSFVGKVVIKVE